MPRISVLMPCYNGMPYIVEAVESVLKQDEQDWELHISDNGSSDGTRDYLAGLSDQRITVYLQPENLGVYGNLNFLLTKPQCDIAKILCADDTLLPNSLDRAARLMEDKQECAVARCLSIGSALPKRASPSSRFEAQLPVSLSPKAALLAFACFGNLVGNLSRATCRPKRVIDAGGFNRSMTYAGDSEGWARVARLYGIELQNEELVFERTHPTQGRVLLTQSAYVNYSQTNDVVSLLASLVDPTDLPLLKEHWAIHFFAPRTSSTIRELLRGNITKAGSIWRDLPPGLSPVRCIAAYPAWRFDLAAAQKTADRLLQRIIELNRPVSG